MTNKAAYVHEPPVQADAGIIWLHGLGADGNDFVGIVDQLNLPDNHSIRFVFPNAPFKNITVNNGMRMRAWYDIYDLNILRKEDVDGIEEAYNTISTLIKEQEALGVPSSRIMLAGFSQGGAMSLYTGLRYSKPLAGIVALSSYLPAAERFDASEHPRNNATPIFMAHGMFDPVVPYSAGQTSCQLLQQEGYAVEWNSYPIVHTLSQDEIFAIGTFVNRCLINA